MAGPAPPLSPSAPSTSSSPPSPTMSLPPTPTAPTPPHHPLRTKLLACLCLILVQIFSSVVLKLSHASGRYIYSPQSSLVLSESAKILLSLAYLLRASRTLPAARLALQRQLSAPLAAHMAGLAALYCANNALMFALFARADPGSIALFKSGATVVSALLLYVWRRFTLSLERWLVITLQMLGLLVAQFDACKGRAHLAAVTYALLVQSLFNSSVANVWNEHVVKQFHDASLATKNVLLYSFGAAFNMLAFAGVRLVHPESPAFFEGYELPAVLVVLSNAFMGIAMNVVYKYADAVVKNLATTMATVALLILSAVLFGGRSNLMVFLGAGVVVIATFLYFAIGVMEDKLHDAKREHKERRVIS